MKINPKLKTGDRVVLLHMEGETMIPGSKGVVVGISKDPISPDVVIYYVKWDGGSTLSLLSDVDGWTLEKPINESIEDMEWFIKNVDIPKNFKTTFLIKYLNKLRETGITNMFQAASFLYMGKKHLDRYYGENPPNPEEFQELLEMADQAKDEMIAGAVKILKKNNQEISVENVSRLIKKYSVDVLTYWMRVKG